MCADKLVGNTSARRLGGGTLAARRPQAGGGRPRHASIVPTAAGGSRLRLRPALLRIEGSGVGALPDFVNGGHEWCVWRILLYDFLTRVAFFFPVLG